MTTIKQYLAAPSEFDQPAVIADLRAGLDVAKRLREHLPGDAPELQQADDTIAAMEAALDAADVVPTPDPGGMIIAYHAAIEELATLRADNDARGVLIEQLRAELAEAERQQRLTALFVRVLREMTPGAE